MIGHIDYMHPDIINTTCLVGRLAPRRRGRFEQSIISRWYVIRCKSFFQAQNVPRQY